MSVVTKTIGTASRNYSTITAFEAAISSFATGADDVVGECYADSVFDEAPLINDTTPISITLTAPSGSATTARPARAS